MAELGLMGVAFPDEYGGTGQGFLELCILIEEQGRSCLPSPFFSTVVLCGLPIARFGTEAQKTEFLSAIVRGRRILAYAVAEPGGFTKEHDMQLYFRHAKQSELAFGDGDYHRELVARMLGL